MQNEQSACFALSIGAAASLAGCGGSQPRRIGAVATDPWPESALALATWLLRWN